MRAGVILDDSFDLQRFVDAQDRVFETAMAELRAGRKRTHWMWFIFPQLVGLGSSPTAMFFAIQSLDEARAYLAHPSLGQRLKQSVEAFLPWAGQRSAEDIYGTIDALKLRSSLTLFDRALPNDIFARALEGFFDGEPDERTLALIGGAR